METENKNETLCQRADNIINKRSEEKERQYGPIQEGIERAAMIATGMSGKIVTADDVYNILIALKFSRISYSIDHEDSYLDAIAYIQAKYNSHNDDKGTRNNSL